MALTNNYRTTMTAREYEEWNQRKEFFELQAQHELAVKEKELEVMRLEAKWSSWMKIPLTIVTLPIKLLLVVPISISLLTKKEIPDNLISLMK